MKAYCIGKSIILPHVRYINNGKRNSMMFHSHIINSHGHCHTLGCNRMDFSGLCEIESLKIMKDNFTERSKGFGFIEMVDENDAKKAIATLNGKDFMGKSLTVAEARPQQKRRGFDDRRGGYGGGMGQGEAGASHFGD